MTPLGGPSIINLANTLEVLQLLIDAGSNVHATHGEGLHELYETSVYGALDVVRFFLGHTNGDASITNNFGWAPIHGAAANGHFECAELLLLKKANASPTSETGTTPLDFVIASRTHYDHVLTGKEHCSAMGCVEREAEDVYTNELKFQMEELLERHGALLRDQLYAEFGREKSDSQKYGHPVWGGRRHRF